MTTMEILARAKAACAGAADLKAGKINEALEKMADRLIAHTPGILTANEADMEAAKEKLSSVMLDRLLLTEARIAAMAEGIRAVAKLALSLRSDAFLPPAAQRPAGAQGGRAPGRGGHHL